MVETEDMLMLAIACHANVVGEEGELLMVETDEDMLMLAIACHANMVGEEGDLLMVVVKWSHFGW
ncbi:hypothetical protein QJS04_geneDACA018020 [Acorus gramineus]|uniref:Uncharacterized protein n=1 Tax=Acorus gramineus TaxID=55184 RepID=A0AAV9AA27_ACOGR|nr:hypothetical protein QJS04_geneDACA018020 [Acorus gramineus]